ncbi:hypothetical protein NM688_g7554 [Phlebia brevispora]|uniref:Uncharacterized protein n=1 Tax=Phlebia brevispora TaxID=194682 RepID=A0ACC1S427_9APHY|nr:hypothetical protein NM688_g7554 [Phlebia brevispora]
MLPQIRRLMEKKRETKVFGTRLRAAGGKRLPGGDGGHDGKRLEMDDAMRWIRATWRTQDRRLSPVEARIRRRA